MDLHKTQGWAHSLSDFSLTILLGATSDRDGIEEKLDGICTEFLSFKVKSVLKFLEDHPLNVTCFKNM